MSEEVKSTLLSFLASIINSPEDETNPLVMCDYLEEQGAHSLALCIRASILFKQEGSKIYVVTSGSYSDYGIRGVFTTRENAQQYIDADRSDGYDSYNDIEEYTLNENISLLRSGVYPFKVTMRVDGNDAQVEKASANSELHDKGSYRQKSYDNDYAVFTTTVWAKDEKHAIKIANERRIAAAVDPERQRRLQEVGIMIKRMAGYRANLKKK